MMCISEEDSISNICDFHSESCIGLHYTTSQEQASSCPTLPLLHSCYDPKMKNDTLFDIQKTSYPSCCTERQQNKYGWVSSKECISPYLMFPVYKSSILEKPSQINIQMFTTSACIIKQYVLIISILSK